MKHKVNVPARDVQPPKNRIMPETLITDLTFKSGLQFKGLEPSELFSHFTANIINENKVFTR